jgi:hypothetical protein
VVSLCHALERPLLLGMKLHWPGGESLDSLDIVMEGSSISDLDYGSEASAALRSGTTVEVSVFHIVLLEPGETFGSCLSQIFSSDHLWET